MNSTRISHRDGRAVKQNPLLRNGYLLSLSSALAAVFGFGYWAVAAWKYDAATVGSNAAAISMMTLVTTVAQINLSSAMVRFVPTARGRTRQLVGCVYLLSGCAAVAVGIGAVVLVRRVSPNTAFFADPSSQVAFVVGTIACTIFLIQEGVLTGLRRTALVPLENFVFVVVKLFLVFALAAVIPSHGIFFSWVAAQGAIVLAIAVFVFMWAIPRHQRLTAGVIDSLPPVREIARYVALDYAGAIFAVGSMALMPILVIAALGAEQSAYFSMAWLVAFSVHLINFNMGTSLVVESAEDPSGLTGHCRHVLAHTSKLLLVVAVPIVIAAPHLLGLFGQSYRTADATLKLLVLSAFPHLVVVVAINSARVLRRMGLVVWTQVMQCVLTLVLMWRLLPAMGIAGAGLAWLVTQTVLALGLLLRRDLWLGPAGAVGAHCPAPEPTAVVGTGGQAGR